MNLKVDVRGPVMGSLGRGVRCWLTAAILAGVSLSQLGCTCSGPAVLAAEKMIAMASGCITILEFLRKYTVEGSLELKVGLEEMRPNLPREKVELSNLTSWEQRLERMREGESVLKERIDDAEDAIEDYLDALEVSAKANQTESLREDSLRGIQKKRDALAAALDRAEDAIQKLSAGIQKYDDILNYLKVRHGLQLVDEKLELLDETIKDAESLNGQVSEAVEEGIRLIEDLAHMERKERKADPVPSRTESVETAPDLPEPALLTSGACGSQCSGGVLCQSPKLDSWWCQEDDCKCPTGLSCLPIDGEHDLPSGLEMGLRFSAVFGSQIPEPCRQGKDLSVCLGPTPECFSQLDACQNSGGFYPVTSKVMRIQSEHLTEVGLDLSVWRGTPDVNFHRDGGRGRPIPSNLLAYGHVGHTEGLSSGALCVGTLFRLRDVSDPEEEWKVRVYAVPTGG